MWRWIVNIMAAVSVLLFIGICGLWVRSYWVGDEYTWWGEELPLCYDVSSRGGQLALVEFRFGGFLAFDYRTSGIPGKPVGYSAHRPPGQGQWERQTGIVQARLHVLGGEVGWGDDGHKSAFRTSGWGILIPHYWLLPPCLPSPLIWLRRWRRRRLLDRRARMGLCLVCGYDLRASPERCPECGTLR